MFKLKRYDGVIRAPELGKFESLESAQQAAKADCGLSLRWERKLVIGIDEYWWATLLPLSFQGYEITSI